MITTHTGRTIDITKMCTGDIDIEDIAHSLSQINRFNGHGNFPISVAQHSCYVSKLCKEENKLQGLLHDAAEAYVGDMTKWLKHHPMMAGYREIERRVEVAVMEKFGLPLDLTNEVQSADFVMVRFEALQIFGPGFKFGGRAESYPPLTPEERNSIGWWGAWPWKEAKENFLECFEMLWDRHGRTT